MSSDSNSMLEFLWLSGSLFITRCISAPPILAVILVVLSCALLSWRLWKFTITPHLRPDEPPELPYWVPCKWTSSCENLCHFSWSGVRLVLGHAVAFFNDSDELLNHARWAISNSLWHFTIPRSNTDLCSSETSQGIFWRDKENVCDHRLGCQKLHRYGSQTRRWCLPQHYNFVVWHLPPRRDAQLRDLESSSSSNVSEAFWARKNPILFEPARQAAREAGPRSSYSSTFPRTEPRWAWEHVYSTLRAELDTWNYKVAATFVYTPQVARRRESCCVAWCLDRPRLCRSWTVSLFRGPARWFGPGSNQHVSGLWQSKLADVVSSPSPTVDADARCEGQGRHRVAALFWVASRQTTRGSLVHKGHGAWNAAFGTRYEGYRFHNDHNLLGVSIEHSYVVKSWQEGFQT